MYITFRTIYSQFAVAAWLILMSCSGICENSSQLISFGQSTVQFGQTTVQFGQSTVSRSCPPSSEWFLFVVVLASVKTFPKLSLKSSNFICFDMGIFCSFLYSIKLAQVAKPTKLIAKPHPFFWFDEDSVVAKKLVKQVNAAHSFVIQLLYLKSNNKNDIFWCNNNNKKHLKYKPAIF